MKNVYRLLLLLIGCFSSCISTAETFIVVSDADSGPGTLRDAIGRCNANGTSDMDHINFNITAVNGRNPVITLLSVLPKLTSGIVIDGSTQPGTNIGISSAKVVLSYYHSKEEQEVFMLLNAENARDIEIYGIYFRSYTDQGAAQWFSQAIYLNDSHNIRIGAPQKGNMFTGWGTSIGYTSTGSSNFQVVPCDSVYVKSNLIGLREDGNSITYGRFSSDLDDAGVYYAIYLHAITNVEIGGDLEGEGNIVNALYQSVYLANSNQGKPGGFLRIADNLIGSNVSRTQSMTTDITNYPVIGVRNCGGGEIVNNSILGVDRNAALNMDYCDSMEIRGNSINVDAYGNQCNSSLFQGIIMDFCNDCLVGGDKSSDPNIIGYTTNLAGISILAVIASRYPGTVFIVTKYPEWI